MNGNTLHDLQASVKDREAFGEIEDYRTIGTAFLEHLAEHEPTRIVSPTTPNYIFYQYPEEFLNKITRPLNTDLFYENPDEFEENYARFIDFLGELRTHEERTANRRRWAGFLRDNSLNRVVYTIQQSIGCIGDSFESPNQSRKRVGDLFENLIRLIIQSIGMDCEKRTIRIPVPDHPEIIMPYELDIVFSRNGAIVAGEENPIYVEEVIGSIKTTSKDRIDKIFLDKYLLSRLLGRDIPVVAIFLHDVQRARRNTPEGRSIFGVNGTFKTNHFLFYTVVLNRMDGVYYIDPRPNMVNDERLRQHIDDFQIFLTRDIWNLTRFD